MKTHIFSKKYFLVVVALITASSTGYSQLTGYSQYQISPTLVNSANAGLYEDVVIGLHYRKQSLSAGDIGFSTGALELLYPIFQKDDGSGNHAYNGNITLTALQEKSGANGMFQTSEIIGGAIYNLELSTNHFLAMGVQGAYFHQRLDISKVTTDNQYNNSSYDPSLPHGEVFNNDATGTILFNTGLTWFGKDENHQTQFWFGASANNLSRSRVDLLSTDAKEPMYLMANGGVVVAKNERMTFTPTFRLTYSESLDQMSTGVLLKYSLSASNADNALTLGAWYNIQKAVTFSLSYCSSLYGIVFAYDMPFGGEYEGEQINTAIEAHLFWRITRNSGSR